MTKIKRLTEDEVERRIREGQEVVIGGIEIHAKFAKVQGNCGICIEYLAPAGRRRSGRNCGHQCKTCRCLARAASWR